MQMIHGSATYSTLQLANGMFKWAKSPQPSQKPTHTQKKNMSSSVIVAEFPHENILCIHLLVHPRHSSFHN